MFGGYMPDSKEIENSSTKQPRPSELVQSIFGDARRLVDLELKLLKIEGARYVNRAEKRLLIILLAFALLIPALYHLGDGIAGWIYLYGGMDEWASKIIVSVLFLVPFAVLLWKRSREN